MERMSGLAALVEEPQSVGHAMPSALQATRGIPISLPTHPPAHPHTHHPHTIGCAAGYLPKRDMRAALKGFFSHKRPSKIEEVGR